MVSTRVQTVVTRGVDYPEGFVLLSNQDIAHGKDEARKEYRLEEEKIQSVAITPVSCEFDLCYGDVHGVSQKFQLNQSQPHQLFFPSLMMKKFSDST